VPADVPELGAEDVPGLGGTESLGVGVGVGVGVMSPGDVLLGCAEGDWLGAGRLLGTMAG
jgi:hypothetical protein